MSDPEKKSCFVICPIGENTSETRKRSDQVLRHIIEPVAERCGYRVERADKLAKPGSITTQIIDHLLKDELVIADLTERNPNVFYELAIRHAKRKPIVQIIHINEIVPFDVSTNRTIKFDYKDMDSVADCKEELEKQIKAVEHDPGLVDSPLSTAIDMQQLAASPDPMAKSNVEIINMLQELKSEISTMKRQLIWKYSYNDDEISAIASGDSLHIVGHSPVYSSVISNPHSHPIAVDHSHAIPIFNSHNVRLQNMDSHVTRNDVVVQKDISQKSKKEKRK